jgi:hypothetical protein
MDFYLCCNSAPIGFTDPKTAVPLGAIRLVTEARCKPPWVLGPAHACSHAYAAWTHTELLDNVVSGKKVFGYRVDGDSPVATISDLVRPMVPTVVWRVSPQHADVWAMRARALELVGTLYDLGELARQLVPGMELAEGVRHAMICTAVVRAIAFAGGGAAREFAGKLPTLFPEDMAQMLAASDGWVEESPFPV